MPLPLAGVNVLEIASGRAAAFSAKQLAELGARVVKLEPPCDGALRDTLAAHLYLDTAKESLAFDLAAVSPGERGTLFQRFDIVVHALQPSYAAALGLLPGDGRERWPGTVFAAITPFGLDGPHADTPATPMTIAALGGYMHITGYPGREPLTHFGHQLESSGGAVATIGILAGLRERERGGPGCYVDVALLEVVTSMLDAWLIAGYTYSGRNIPRQGNRTGPLGSLPASDGFVNAHPLNERNWQDLVAVTGLTAMGEDPRLATHALRVANYPLAMEHLEPWSRERTVREVFEALQAVRIPSSPNVTFAELRDDPQTAARGYFREVEHPVAGRLAYPGVPFVSDTLELRVERAPLLDEHDALPEPRPRAAMAATAAAAGPLDGVRIVDFTQVWAGPFATEMLAELGADVIHIESRYRPDVTRWWGVEDRAAGPTWERSASFAQPNRSKRSLVLNLNEPGAKEVFRDLLRASDVLISNFSTRVLPNFGFDPAAVLEANPRLVYLAMPAFGASGPYADYVSTGDVMEGGAGLVRHAGYGPNEFCRSGTALCDPYGSFHAAAFILTALRNRDRHGCGAFIDLSQRDAALRFVGEEWLAYQLTGEEPHQWNNEHPEWSPHRAYPCAGEDRWVAVAVRDAADWQALCRAMHRPDLAVPDLDAVEARRARAAEIDAAIEDWTHDRESAWIAGQLTRAGVPAGAVQRAAEVVEHPQSAYRGFFPWVDHPAVGPTRLHAMPVVLHGRPETRTDRRAPLFDEHTDEVLAGVLGYAAERIEAQRVSGAVGGELKLEDSPR